MDMKDAMENIQVSRSESWSRDVDGCKELLRDGTFTKDQGMISSTERVSKD